MKEQRETPFFVGYLPVPQALRVFVWAVGLALVFGAGIAGYLVGAAQDDPGSAAYRFDYGRQTVSGVVELTPAPVLHVSQGTEAIPAGRTLMLSGQGKNGAIARASELGGRTAQASGILLERGDLIMLQLTGGQRGLAGNKETADLPAPRSLGRWRLAGEICDGKCLSGAMRPGRGLSHRACANLCISGGIPAVFVSSQPVEGHEFFLIAGTDGASLDPALLNHVAQYISAEGEIALHGDLPVLTIDPASVEVLP